LALLFTLVRKLSEWLSTDALSFRFLFVADGDNDALAAERGLLDSLLMDEIANGSVHLAKIAQDQIAGECAKWGRRSLCHALLIDVRPRPLHADDTVIDHLQIDGPHPALVDADEGRVVPDGDDPLESWGAVLQEILQRWI
jgi:hypothetical protein